MTLDVRALRLLTLGAWSAFLLWLWASDEVLRYLGQRTEWIVPAGGIALALATIAYARGTTSPARPSRPSPAELAGTVALLVPIVVAAVLSGASLGSLAASKKLTARGVDLAALARLESGRSGELSFLDLQAAGRDAGFAREKDIHPGRPVSLSGFVATPPAGGGRFQLARFYISCCVADAIPVGVTVDPAGAARIRAHRDEWLSVTGAVFRDGDAFGIRALRIKPIPQPKHPYLAFTT